MAYSRRLTLVDDRVGLIFMASIFSVLIILAVILRFWSRRITRTPSSADDWLAVTALLFVLALNGIFIGGTVQGAITGHSPIENNWPVTTELEHLAQKYKYAFQTTEKIAFGLIKISILLLWRRLLGRMRPFSTACWAMIVVVFLWSTAFFFATLFQCGTEWTKNWAPIGIFLTQCSDTLLMLTVFTGTDLLTDFIIMLMPVPIIWGLQMSMKQKIGVTSIFMVGLLTIGAGIARMYIYLVTSYDKETNPDFIGDFTLFILWSEIEVNVAMIVCCMPTWAPVLTKSRRRLSEYLRSRNSRSKFCRGDDDSDMPVRLIAPQKPRRNHFHGPSISTTASSHAPLDRHDSGSATLDSGIMARTEIHMITEQPNFEQLNGSVQHDWRR